MIHPGVCFGKMVFRGTRVPVKTVLTYLAMGETINDILAGWPELKREAVREAIELAAAALQNRYQIERKGDHEPRHSGRAT
jgi:uncharacterized protein (DUF433 family)